MKNQHIGSSLDNLLEKEVISAEAQAIAVSRILAWGVN
jgi:hypothetical protein